MQNVRNVTAVLGPTNTGKTHLAVSRMLGHETGMIGLPLRLLAREIYDRICLQNGPEEVALITGEEKIIPVEPRYYVCTVEAMPLDLQVDFLAIDEVQLAADFERGHIFTDRILHRRGMHETMLLGAETIRDLLEKLLPGINVVTRPRFSVLSYSGQKKITRLPRRTAIVAFSASTVYAIAELIRRQRGGAAVVMGALSPRTRNAQVELYQSGHVDFLVATDAIGMGLNMDVDHVAFAATKKFDGRIVRELTTAELAQIGGRAGRHVTDGTFGVTGEAMPLSNIIVSEIEDHRFPPIRVAQWRNRDLDFSSLETLSHSLNKAPNQEGLTRALPGDDIEALEFLTREPDFRALAQDAASVQLLWDVCQIPDYRNITGAEHALIVSQVFRYLRSDKSLIPSDWFARQLSYADRADGDIDTLANRIAHVRTWTFLAHRNDWLEDAAGWQQRAMEIENKLSDALHERLTQRFIDRRTSVLMRRLREKEELMASVSEDGDVHVEGEFIGQLKGFRFQPDESADDAHAKTLKAASMKAIAAEISNRASICAKSKDEEFALTHNANIEWRGANVARLETGSAMLKPKLVLLANDQLTGTEREAVQSRLQEFVSTHILTVLEPLVGLSNADDLEGMARGLAFQLTENLGVLNRDEVAEEVKELDQTARASLRKYGVRFGAYHVFMPALLKPAAAELKLLLWAIWSSQEGKVDVNNLPQPPGQGLTSTVFDNSTPRGFYQAVGYRICGTRVVRIDMLERLADVIRPKVYWKPQKDGDERPEGSIEGGGFTVIADMMSLVGCSGEDMASILRALGYRMERRKIKTPVTQDNADTKSDENSETQAAQPVQATPGDEATPPAGSEPASDVEQKSEQSPVSTSEKSTDTAAGDLAASAPSTDPAGETPQKPEEPDFIEIWRPAARNKGKQNITAKAPHKQGKSSRDGDKSKAPRGKQDRGARATRRPKQPERQHAPKKPEMKPEDSPFAALTALKEKLSTQPEKGKKDTAR